MRVVSLVPAATEIAWALGATRDLVAVTHDCDFPPELKALPRVTRSTIPPSASSGEIDALVREAGERGESTFHLDAGALAEARPEVILGQTLCRVCAVTLDQVPATLPRPPAVVPLEGGSIEGVLADVVRVAAALGRQTAGDSLVRALRARLDGVAQAVARQPRPRVVCLEWLDPLYNAGHWVPEQVALAGGHDVLGVRGERSRVIIWEEVLAAAPEVLVAMPCGFGAARALQDARALRARPGWDTLPAARRGSAFAVDGNAYFSRPGPRLVEGVELLAWLFHPDARPAPPGAVALRVAEEAPGRAATAGESTGRSRASS